MPSARGWVASPLFQPVSLTHALCFSSRGAFCENCSDCVPCGRSHVSSAKSARPCVLHALRCRSGQRSGNRSQNALTQSMRSALCCGLLRCCSVLFSHAGVADMFNHAVKCSAHFPCIGRHGTVQSTIDGLLVLDAKPGSPRLARAVRGRPRTMSADAAPGRLCGERRRCLCPLPLRVSSLARV